MNQKQINSTLRSLNNENNYKVTSVVVNSNDTASFYSGTTLLQTFKRVHSIRRENPENGGQNIVIIQENNDVFKMTAWYLENIGVVNYPALNISSPTINDEYQVRINDVFIQLSEVVFKGCCDCGGGGECLAVNVYNTDGTLLGTPASGSDFIAPDGEVLLNGAPYGFVPSDGLINVISTAADGTAENSDNTYSISVPSGGTVILPDTVYNVYLDGILQSTSTLPSMVNQTINIIY